MNIVCSQDYLIYRQFEMVVKVHSRIFSLYAVPTCPAGQSFKCGPPVPPSCDNPDGTDGVCVQGCFCNDGTILNANGQCVSEDQCEGKLSMKLYIMWYIYVN